MCGLLAGRAAEDIIFGAVSTGAQNDLDRVTKIAYSLITIYGMNSKVGNISFHEMSKENQFAKPFSEQTAQLIDTEARILIDQQYQRALKLLSDKRSELELIANELLEHEVLHQHDVERLIGKRPFDETTDMDTSAATTTDTTDELSDTPEANDNNL
jgi:AFG3 family protein